MNTLVANTPNYVLMNDKSPLGPEIVPLRCGLECSIIYGFSDKDPYDTFCMNSQLALTPYPLLKGYLRNQTHTSIDGLKLIVMDANGPCEPYLQAVTMRAVLAAQENLAPHVTVEYQLIFDPEANNYRVEEDFE